MSITRVVGVARPNISRCLKSGLERRITVSAAYVLPEANFCVRAIADRSQSVLDALSSIFPRAKSTATSEEELPVEAFSHDAPHFHVPHNVWSQQSVAGVRVTVVEPGTIADGAAFAASRVLGGALDLLTATTGIASGRLRKIVVLEAATTAPASSCLVLRCLRTVSRWREDKEQKWLELCLRDDSKTNRFLNIGSSLNELRGVDQLTVGILQQAFARAFGLAFLLWPRFGRLFAEHVHEELLQAYTQLVDDLEKGCIPELSQKKVPVEVLNHFSLPPEATFSQVIEQIRQDRLHCL